MLGYSQSDQANANGGAIVQCSPGAKPICLVNPHNNLDALVLSVVPVLSPTFYA